MYPALAVLQAARCEEKVGKHALAHPESIASHSSLEVFWIGSEGGMEAGLIEREALQYDTIPAAGVHGVGLRSLPGNLVQLLRGFLKSRKFLRQYQPDVLLFTGGFLAVPMALAGIKRPSLLFVPDIEPGLALRAIAPFADHIAVSTKETSAFFSKYRNVTLTGYPVREDLLKWKKPEAYNALGLKPDLPVLLVFGGSKGARSINHALGLILEELLSEMQVIHICGELDWQDIEKNLQRKMENASQPEIVERYRVFPYLHDEMGAALRLADVVVSRAGASILGEFPSFGAPAILVPYPHAWRYQRLNAEYLAKHGAAVIVKDSDLSRRLLPTALELMNDPERRAKMRQAMRKLAMPDAASNIFQLLESLGIQRSLKGSER